jgi:hypothetical protein
MAASGFTPIQLYRTSTPSAVPTAGNLAAGELAINLTDEALYFKNAAGVVTLLADSSGALGSVTSVNASGGTTGLTFSGGPVTSSGTLTLGGTLAVANGGTGATTAGAARTALGATTLGGNLFTITNPGAVTFPRFNADNTVSALNAADFRTAIGAGTGGGSVTSVSGAGTVNGLTLTGTVTSSGSLTLGGTLSGVSLTTAVTGTLPIANGGTNATTAGQALTNLGAYPASNPNGYTSNAGTVTSVGGTGTVNGITLTGSVTSSGNLTLGGTLSGVSLTTQVTGTLPTANGGTGATTASAARTNLGATTVGSDVFTAVDAAAARTAIGAGTGNGTVTSVSGTGSANGLSLSGTVTSSGNITLSGSVTSVASNATIDGVTIGFRNIPRSTTSGTATTADVGKCIAVSAGLTVPSATFGAGDAVSIYNDSASAVTITQGSGLTLRQGGTTNTGNRTLAPRGMATIWFNSASEAIITGAGVS